ncbi:MAG TPA: DegT/DnrJ/EryC1/StrS family aminotransferase [Proteobacteria bacterium]|nr:DegT/DnrJ/EryC1/StrS family aminotransferase [Pseudomonadota bacterium]
MKVNFLDLKAQYETIKDEIADALQGVLDRTAFAGGPFVAKFEEEFAAYCGTRHAVGVGSGTEALWFALLAAGVGHGDEVITAPNTFIATAEAISFTGATPVFVDIDESTHNMDPNLIEGAITSKTKAIIPIHLFGQPADMDPIRIIAKKYGLFLLEDSCQAHGARYKGRRTGSLGDAGAFSFYPGKNLGAYGEAGAVTTDDDDLAAKMRMLRDHGQSKKYYHGAVGWNGRMDGFQGAVLSVKLRYLDRWNNARKANADRYHAALNSHSGLLLPTEADYANHVYHLFAVRVENRDAFIDAMGRKEIYCGIHYPIPVHLQEAYSSLELGKGSFPIAEKCASEYVSLPMFPELKPEEIEYTASAIREILG